MLRRPILVLVSVLLLGPGVAACGGDDDTAATVTAAPATAPGAGDNEAQLALTVQVPQYLDDIKSGAKEGGRSGATDKLIAVLNEHRAALGDERVEKALRDAAAYARQYCPECAAELEAEANRVAS